MIHFDDWLLTKDEGPVIARQYDNLTRRLEILGDIPEGWSWTLLVQAGTHLDIVALAPMEGGLGVDLTKEMLAIGGYYKLQLKGTKGELVRHTNQLHNVLIPASLSGDANWPEVPSEFSQMEANIRELGEHPPIPGDGGYWLVWDLERNEYVTSDLPLPDVSVGPAGKAATIKVGETVTGDPGTQAAVENTGTENAAVLRFTIPRGAVGPTGATPAISVEVTGLPAGAEPTVEVSGTPEKPVIALGIPQGKQGDPGGKGDPGDPGQTPNITIGQVETLPAESPVTASITGQTPNLVLNLGIPQGKQGDTGQAATIEIIETETVAPDTPAAMVELPESTPQARRYKAQVPQGVQGPAGSGGLTLWNFNVRQIANIALDAGDLPAYVDVTQDMEGKPFSAKGVIVQTDISSAVSYSSVQINPGSLPWTSQFAINNNGSGFPLLVILGKATIIAINGRDYRTEVNVVGARMGSHGYTWTSIPESIVGLRIGEQGGIKSGTFIKVWEVLE